MAKLNYIRVTDYYQLENNWYRRFTVLSEREERECHLKDMGEISTSNWTRFFQAVESRIIGGKSTNLIHYPFMVQFYNYGGLCGGVIVTSKTVLTAGHCFSHNTNLAEMKIFSNPRFTFDISAQIHEVWDFAIHENYGHNLVFANDIAIIIIHDKFIFGPQVKKATFTETDAWMKEKEVFVATGWGEKTYGAGLPQTDLQMIYLHYVNSEKCETINQYKLAPGMFCLYGDGKRDTCRGDSGGGVLWNGAVVGIVSHGKKCAESPGIYMNVYFYSTWIEKTVKSLYEKFCDFHRNKI